MWNVHGLLVSVCVFHVPTHLCVPEDDDCESISFSKRKKKDSKHKPTSSLVLVSLQQFVM